MAKWGAEWGLGAPWGIEPLTGPAEVCTLADSRLLVQMDDTTGNRKFRDMICDLLFENGVFGDVAADVAAAFDVDVAQGVHLDSIGSVVGLPRQGFDDNDYRRFLQIQIKLLLSGNREGANSTGTHENILSICRTFIGPGVPDPILLTNLPPYAFLLTIPTITGPEMDVLATFLRTAVYAGVLGQAVVLLGPDSLWNSASVAVTSGGTWASASVAVAGSATWGRVVVI